MHLCVFVAQYAKVGMLRCMKVISFQSDSFEVARLFSESEARRVGSLLQISSDALQTVITHRVTVSSVFSSIYALSFIGVLR